MSTTFTYAPDMDDELDDLGLKAWEAFVFAHASVIGRIERDLAAAKLTPFAWYDVLAALSEAPDQRLRLHELASEVVLSRSGLTRLLDRIERAGLISREPCSTDRRGSFAVLTRDGQDALNKTWPTYAERIARYFANHLDDEEKRVIATALRRVREQANG